MKKKVLLNDFICEISYFDSQKESDVEMLAELLYRNKVLILRNQNISVLQYQQLMSTLGRFEQHPLQNFAIKNHPNIIKISNYILPDGKPEGVLDGGAYWHTDMSYKPFLGIFTSLLSQRVSSQSSTQFIDMVDALQLLKSNIKLSKKIENTCGVPLEEIKVHHVFGNRQALKNPMQPTQLLTSTQQKEVFPVKHNLVQHHPCINSASLFSVAGTAFQFDGVTLNDSFELLNELENYIVENAQFYEHKYLFGDLLIWDNLQTLHRGFGISAIQDINESRLLYRINISY